MCMQTEEYTGFTLYREAELEVSALLSSSGVLSGSSGICPRTCPQKKYSNYKTPTIISLS